jgi:archaellum component FlaC/predicted outer membrane lipoprotein
MLQRHGAILQQHSEILLEVVKEQNYLRGALDQVNERFGTLDSRMNSMENRIVSVENRMIALEDRMGSFDARLTDTYASLSKDIRDNFKWTIGLMIPVWFGILVAIIVELVKG